MCVFVIVLSAEGEQYVDDEMKRALLGVKQMKETLDKTEEKHQQLIKTLKSSHDKKRVTNSNYTLRDKMFHGKISEMHKLESIYL